MDIMNILMKLVDATPCTARPLGGKGGVVTDLLSYQGYSRPALWAWQKYKNIKSAIFSGHILVLKSALIYGVCHTVLQLM